VTLGESVHAAKRFARDALLSLCAAPWLKDTISDGMARISCPGVLSKSVAA